MNSFDGVSYALHTNNYGDTFSVDFRKSEDMDDFEVYSVRLGVNDVNEYNMRPTDAARDIAATTHRPSAATSTKAKQQNSASTSAPNTAPASAPSG